ncbi:MAG: calcium-binding protein [bacterium]|nr:calcium-binding protein [bacterium]
MVKNKLRSWVLLGAVTLLVVSIAPALPAAVLPALCHGEIPDIVGTDGDDMLMGTSGDDIIQALGGNDTIYGLGGDDLICAAGGHDIVEGGNGRDLIFGGSGSDTLRGQQGHDALSGGRGMDEVYGGTGRDVLVGNKGNDMMWGRTGEDFLDGNLGSSDDAFGGRNRDWCRAESKSSCEGPFGHWRLKATGIGPIDFGTPTDTALVEFALFGDPMTEGDPDEDSGWIDSFSIYGTCPNEQVRMVRWGNLRTFYTRTGLTEGTFFFWDVLNGPGYADKKLSTPAGLRFGDTRGQLELLYTDLNVDFIEPFGFWHFYVNGNTSGITGSLSGDDIGDKITYLQGGIGCGE